MAESQIIEYKQSWHDEYLKWICGYANAQGGTLYIGINDDAEVCGVRDSKKLLEDIPNKIIQSMGIHVEVNLTSRENRDIIEIHVDPFSMPISYKGKYYYRTGSTLQELSGASLQQFLLRKMGTSWDDVIVPNATIDDIDRKAIDYFINAGIENGRILASSRQESTGSVLENLHLVNTEGKIKTAAILLFGKDPLKFFTCVRFRIGRFGTSESDLMFQDEIEGCLVNMADKVIQVLRSKYLRTPIHYEGMQRKEPLEIPEPALRELLYNAIVHKDYLGVDIQMKVYDDRIWLWNEGELPEGYNNEVLFGPHTSKPRNKNIAYAFYKMGFIESWGRGFDKITDSFTDAQLSLPIVESKFGGVLTIIPRREQVKVTRNLERGQVEGTSNLERGQVTGQVERLLAILTEDMGIQRMMLELNLKSRDKFLQNYLNPATMLGLIEMTQPNSPKSPTQKYRLTEKGKQLREQIINDK